MKDQIACSIVDGSSARTGSCIIVPLVLFLHAALLAWSAWVHSPTADEAAHLSAGLNHWRTGSFELYRVNPPLVRMLAAVPVVFARPRVGSLASSAAARRPEFGIGIAFTRENGCRSAWLFSLARWVCIPLSVLGGYVCYRWARALYGDAAGLFAMVLWSFSPNVLGHGQLITPDVGAAALGVLACYMFWQWLRAPDWSGAVFAGLGLGLAELTKFTWVVLFGIWPAVWLVRRFSQPPRQRGRRGWREGAQVATIFTLGLCAINVGYAFEDSFKSLGAFNFASGMLGGSTVVEGEPGAVGNRLRGTWLGGLRAPLPANYLSGIDLQRFDFERGDWSYLAGQWRFGGWWYYYLYALAVKVPSGTWIFAILTILATARSARYSAPWRDELALLAPAVGVLVLVSSQTGFTIHARYVLPAFPFAFIWISKIAKAFEFASASRDVSPCERGWVGSIWPHAFAPFHGISLAARFGVSLHGAIAAVASVALAWSMASCLWVYPHCLSYFNEFAGGPANGHAHLLDSNIDWGQDLFYLSRWLDAHRQVRLAGLAYFGIYPPELAGIEARCPPRMPDARVNDLNAMREASGPQPGWYAVSVNALRGHLGGRWIYASDFTYFQRLKPVAMAGYSIYIYHVTREEANRVRRELGLPELIAKDGG